MSDQNLRDVIYFLKAIRNALDTISIILACCLAFEVIMVFVTAFLVKR